MGTRTFITALAVGILASAGLAHADTVNGSLSGDPSLGVNPGTSDLSVTFGSLTYNPAFVGKINWTTGASSTDPFFTGSGVDATSFSTYCIEGNQDVYFGSNYTWNASALAPGVQAPDHGAGSVYFTNSQVSDLTSFWNRYYDTSLLNATNATAFQVGIWEIAGDDVLSTTGTATSYFTTGNFKASSNSAVDTNALNEAATWLDAVATGGSYATANEYSILALTNSSAQDQLVGIPTPNSGGSPPSTPIPAALPAGLSVMGVMGAAQLLRRRRQTVAA
jgi:hypothetical protein